MHMDKLFIHVLIVICVKQFTLTLLYGFFLFFPAQVDFGYAVFHLYIFNIKWVLAMPFFLYLFSLQKWVFAMPFFTYLFSVQKWVLAMLFSSIYFQYKSGFSLCHFSLTYFHNKSGF